MRNYCSFFPKWIRNSGNLINHWAQFKDPVSHMCLAGAVVASWSLTQEVACSNNVFKMFSHLGKTQMSNHTHTWSQVTDRIFKLTLIDALIY